MERKLNKLQVAYVLGRQNYLPLGGVAMHDFREYRGDVDLDVFKNCLREVVEKHNALRIVIDHKKFSQKESTDLDLNLKIIDYQNDIKTETLSKIEQLREQVSHYKHESNKSPWGVWFIQLNKKLDVDYHTVILFSFDGLILDGYSISSIINEIIILYRKNKTGIESVSPQVSSNLLDCDNLFKVKDIDKAYWLKKLEGISKISFPWKTNLEEIPSSRYKRSNIVIKKNRWDELSGYAKKNAIFPNSLINTIILKSLCTLSEREDIYVGLPISFSLYNKELSNLSTIIPLYYRTNDDSLVNNAKNIQSDTMNGLNHVSYSGIEIARELCSKFKNSIPFPIVITNALSWKVEPYDSSFYYHSGLTQTPQVALDIRIQLTNTRNLSIDFDFAVSAISESLINDLMLLINKEIKLITS
ncbi:MULTISPECIES: condensation domain-containing protein [Providencia]|uniref:Condensation domain-containing protein n=2 Tax=Providencia TaxID=586 RepID=A0ABD5L6L8_PROST|nr:MULTISPECIES: condensation domain-containing protein [Providencia]ELR5292395.1 hypothetical protein [Providencia stuartii]MCR4181072.1 condensation domain-containing protein [Providencia vermicola]URE79589.1 condensation domain-containing protein [Providencia stuartii]